MGYGEIRIAKRSTNLGKTAGVTIYWGVNRMTATFLFDVHDAGFMFGSVLVNYFTIVDAAGKMLVKPLQEPLEGVSPKLRVNYDEKPLFPDHPCNRTLVIDGDTIVAPVNSRSKTWTLATAVNAAGEFLHATIFLRGSENAKCDQFEGICGLSPIPMVNLCVCDNDRSTVSNFFFLADC